MKGRRFEGSVNYSVMYEKGFFFSIDVNCSIYFCFLEKVVLVLEGLGDDVVIF